MVTARTSSPHLSQRTPALGLRLLLLASLSILILVVDHRENHLDAVRRAIGATVYPLRVVVDAPVAMWRWIRESGETRNELRLENSRLNAERLLTHARLQRYSALESENARLRAMLEARTRVKDEVRVAGIMSVSANPFRHVLVIDKGQNEGVYAGQAMIAGFPSHRCVPASSAHPVLAPHLRGNGSATSGYHGAAGAVAGC